MPTNIIIKTYLNFSALNNGAMQFFSGFIRFRSFGKCDEAKTFWSTLVEYDFHIQ